MATKLHTVCNRDCPDACGIVATVEDGRVLAIAGVPEHPVTRGFLCERTSRFLRRQYDPQRLVQPLLRRGDGFESVDWDAALGFVAARVWRACHPDRPARADQAIALELARAEGVAFAAADGVELRGWFLAGEEGRPAVVLCHDLGGSSAQMINLGIYLHRLSFFEERFKSFLPVRVIRAPSQ